MSNPIEQTAPELQHELNIRTSDGWVVTLVSDKPIDLGDVIVESIIVQPLESHVERIKTDAAHRTEYKLQVIDRRRVR